MFNRIGDIMKTIAQLSLLAILALIAGILVSCSFPTTTNPSADTLAAQATPALIDLANLKLEIEADTSIPIGTEGQVVKINYIVRNTGTTALTGSLTVTGATCPAINTVGNLDTNFDPKEQIICTSDHPVTKADMDAGSFRITANASMNGVTSKDVTLTVPIKVLTMTKTADPATFSQVGQQITYTYVIQNSGAVPIGPTQFVVNDPSVSAPFACGDANTLLAPGATVTCKATYTISQADVDAGTVTSGGTASTGGVEPSPDASVTITRTGVVTNPNPTVPTNQTNLTPGSTIQYKVVDGEWMWQIARCYGVDPQKLIDANPQLVDPSEISPDMTINVPNIGSAGTLYGPPCVVIYKVQPGDTWESIAQQYNADVTLLKIANKGVLSTEIVVPRNSIGATTGK
jgi:uncharacterized repeat protein (TIGR01451 family)